MKPTNSAGTVVPSTTPFRNKRNYVSIDYPNKRVGYLKLWDLAKKCVDTFTLAGWQNGKTPSGKVRSGADASAKEAPTYTDQRKVLEFLVANRKQAPVEAVRAFYSDVMEIPPGNIDTMYFLDQREVVHVSLYE